MNIFVNMITNIIFSISHSYSALLLRSTQRPETICQLLLLPIERIFSYDFDSLINNRNRLTADSL